MAWCGCQTTPGSRPSPLPRNRPRRTLALVTLVEGISGVPQIEQVGASIS